MRTLVMVLSLMLVAQIAVEASKKGEPTVNGTYKNKIQCGYFALEMRNNEAAKAYFIEGKAMFKEQNSEATEIDMAKVFAYERGFMHGYLAGQKGSISSMEEVNKMFAHAYEDMCTNSAGKSKSKGKKKK